MREGGFGPGLGTRPRVPADRGSTAAWGCGTTVDRGLLRFRRAHGQRGGGPAWTGARPSARPTRPKHGASTWRAWGSRFGLGLGGSRDPATSVSEEDAILHRTMAALQRREAAAAGAGLGLDVAAASGARLGPPSGPAGSRGRQLRNHGRRWSQALEGEIRNSLLASAADAGSTRAGCCRRPSGGTKPRSRLSAWRASAGPAQAAPQAQPGGASGRKSSLRRRWAEHAGAR